jgi:putative nucleotidyltransferase with HDIG domain
MSYCAVTREMYVSRVTVAGTRPRPGLALAISLSVIATCVVIFLLSDVSELRDPLTLVLIVIGSASVLVGSYASANLTFAPSFISGMLAIAFLGPAGAFVVPLANETIAWLALRYRWRALMVNLAVIPGPTLLAALIFAAADPVEGSAEFYFLLAGAVLVTLALNLSSVGVMMDILDGRPLRLPVREFAGFTPTVALATAMTLTIAAGYIDYGMPALAALLIAVTGAGYMLRLVAGSREQAREYANLSWGVLSSLVRTLNERDDRASRHSAAVARFSRDMADVAGLDAKHVELAHTSGLLHDIGKFVLSDRVMERGTRLTEVDWRGIRRHPDIGADLLRDIGVFGPVAEIVRCHHERVDGRGYPRGLTADEIPEVAKIVAVAEVYDTLTAPDTYRTPMNSFEALRELRRVAGTQLDATYVETLANLLAGRSLEYRHADAADFDVELAMERRISEAATLT